MFTPVRIAPSILSADFMRLGDQIRLIEDGGAGFIHVDVMDGHFVPNITIGVPHVKQLKAMARIPLDVHLMIANPLTQVPWFLAAGADMVTVHAETLEPDQMAEMATMIHDGGAQAGISVKPNTPISLIKSVIGLYDMVLVMSVEPGFSGQSYIEGTDAKVAEVARIAAQCNPDLLIEVDGGMDTSTVGFVCAQGADVIVCGNAVFKAADPVAAIHDVKAEGDAARLGAGR